MSKSKHRFVVCNPIICHYGRQTCPDDSQQLRSTEHFGEVHSAAPPSSRPQSLWASEPRTEPRQGRLARQQLPPSRLLQLHHHPTGAAQRQQLPGPAPTRPRRERLHTTVKIIRYLQAMFFLLRNIPAQRLRHSRAYRPYQYKSDNPLYKHVSCGIRRGHMHATGLLSTSTLLPWQTSCLTTRKNSPLFRQRQHHPNATNHRRGCPGEPVW